MSVSVETDETLMRQYQAGDITAFDELYRRYAPRVYGYLCRRLADRGAVDEVHQTVFLKLHQTRAAYDPTLAFTPWLFTICRTVLIDRLRKMERQQELATAYEEELAAVPLVAAVGGGAEDGGLSVSLEALAPDQRAAVELRYLEGLSFEQIAARLKTSPVNARQKISRAVRKLRDALLSEQGGK